MDQSHEHFPTRRRSNYGDENSTFPDNIAAGSKPESFFLDNIIVGYAFGPKKMETMGLIMAEASKALSTFECAETPSSTINKRQLDAVDISEESSLLSMTTVAASMLTSHATRESNADVEKEPVQRNRYFSDNDEDARSLSSTYTGSSYISQRSHQRGLRGNSAINGIQLRFVDSGGFIHSVRSASLGASMGEGESITGSSITTSASNLMSLRKQGASSASCSSTPISLSSSCSKEMNEPPNAELGYNGEQKYCHPLSQRSNNGSGEFSNYLQQHPIRVSFVPIDLDTPLEEQHGGKFDVILHKMTEDILSMSNMLRTRGLTSGALKGSGDGMLVATDEQVLSEATMIIQPVEDQNLFQTTPSMTRHQVRASQRIQRLLEYKQRVHPSCVLVDSPNNILAVMSRADMAEVLSRCLAGVSTTGGIPVRTPRFRVVDEGINLEAGTCMKSTPVNKQSTLADEIDDSGFEYPLISKPLTAAGTKSSHHMGIVLARDGLQRLKAPCLLQEYANHGEKLFKVYVLGESVWIYSRESLPNLPMGENQVNIHAGPYKLQGKPCGEGCRQPRAPQKRPLPKSYVEFERPAGSRCYVEFNSQHPYPKLSDFGIISEVGGMSSHGMQDHIMLEQSLTRCKRPRKDDGLSLECGQDKKRLSSAPPFEINQDRKLHSNSDLSRFVTKDEIEPVTTALREAFGLELFGFDVLVKHSQDSLSNPSNRDNSKEILVVDVNYFPGYKEVPNFPSLLAQYLTQKAVESRLKNFDGS